MATINTWYSVSVGRRGFTISYNISPYVCSSGVVVSMAQHYQRPDFLHFLYSAVPSRLSQILLWCQESCLSPKYRIFTHQSPGLNHFPCVHLLLKMKKMYTETYQQTCLQFIAHNQITCQSSMSHCWGNGTIIVGFDKSEPDPQEGGVDTRKPTEILPADKREKAS